MSAQLLAVLGVAAGLALIGGCAAPAAGPNPLIVSAEDFDDVFQASRDALHARFFEEDRVDRRDGVITTLPSTAGDSWEIWRRDSADTEGRALASLHTVRKTALVKIAEPDPGRYQVVVTVTVERQQAPDLEPTTTSELYSLYDSRGLTWQSDRDPSGVASQAPRWERRTGVWWTDIGRDMALEEAILNDIAAKLGAAATGQPATRPAQPNP